MRMGIHSIGSPGGPAPSPRESGTAPLVSVVIPVHNRSGFVGTAVRSVAQQTFAGWEAIVVDDGSSDGSGAAALQAGPPSQVRVIRHEQRRGSAEARNSGMLASRGRFISFLDSDDSWEPEKLQRQVDLVEADADPETVFCVTQTTVSGPRRRVRVLPARAPFPDEPWSDFLYLNGGFAQTSSFFLSRSLAMTVRFRSSVVPHEDHFFFLELESRGARYKLVREPLSNWNDDPRSDRLSSDTRGDCSRQYLDQASRLLTVRARLAFEVRHLGPVLFRRNPIKTVRLFRKASRCGVVRGGQMLSVWARCLLPAPAVALLKSRFA